MEFGRNPTLVHSHTHIYMYTHVYIYIYIHIYHDDQPEQQAQTWLAPDTIQHGGMPFGILVVTHGFALNALLRSGFCRLHTRAASTRYAKTFHCTNDRLDVG